MVRHVSIKRAGQHPPTSVVNLIFVLANHAAVRVFTLRQLLSLTHTWAQPLASVHFDGSFNFLDLFLPHKKTSSEDRARVFLWLIYHYLESSAAPNPFDDDYSRKTPGRAPSLRSLTDAELAKENVDTQEEIDWGNMMSKTRNIFLHRLVSTIEYEKKSKTSTPHFISGSLIF